MTTELDSHSSNERNDDENITISLPRTFETVSTQLEAGGIWADPNFWRTYKCPAVNSSQSGANNQRSLPWVKEFLIRFRISLGSKSLLQFEHSKLSSCSRCCFRVQTAAIILWTPCQLINYNFIADKATSHAQYLLVINFNYEFHCKNDCIGSYAASVS